MDWKAHFIFGFLLFLLFGYFLLNIFDSITLLFYSFLCGLFALIPDLDHELSKSRKILDKLVPTISFVLGYIYFNNILNSIYLTILVSGIYFIFFAFLKPKHRGITHSILFLLVCFAIIYFFNNFLGIVFFIGYLSHLLLDRTLKLI